MVKVLQRICYYNTYLPTARGVGDKPMSCKPGIPGSMLGFSQYVGYDFKAGPRLLRRFKIRTTVG